jgi:hypothetical protein
MKSLILLPVEGFMYKDDLNKINGQILGSLKQVSLIESSPQIDSFSTHVNAFSKVILKTKSEWLTTLDIYSIYYNLIFKLISEFIKDDIQYTGTIADLVPEDILIIKGQELAGFYNSIPRKYDIYLQLPNVSKEFDESIQLNKNISILCQKKAPYEKTLPAHKGIGLGLFTDGEQHNKSYLKLSLCGYCNSSLNNKTIQKALSVFKILLHQGEFRNFFKVTENNSNRFGMLGINQYYPIPKINLVSLDVTSEDGFISYTELPISFSKFLHCLDIKWENPQISNLLQTGSIREPIQSFLKSPCLLIENEEDESKRIKAAIEWSFDSMIEDNETMSFIKVCIGLESLLGDARSNGSLTDTLADRCAYLVSGDIKGRKKIKKSFIDLYEARSKLIHGVNISLLENQRKFLHWGEYTLKYAIAKEIKHLNLNRKRDN